MVEARDLAGHLTTHNITVWFFIPFLFIQIWIKYSNQFDQPILS